MPSAAQTPTAGLMPNVFPRSDCPARAAVSPFAPTLRANERANRGNLQEIFIEVKKFLVGVDIELYSLGNTHQEAKDGPAEFDRAQVFLGNREDE